MAKQHQTNLTQLTQPSTEAPLKQQHPPFGPKDGGMLANRRERCSSGQIAKKPLKKPAAAVASNNNTHIMQKS